MPDESIERAALRIALTSRALAGASDDLQAVEALQPAEALRAEAARMGELAERVGQLATAL